MNQDSPEIIEQSEIVLYPSRKKYVGLLIISLGFVVVGFFDAAHGDVVVGWSCMILFGLGGIVAGVQFLPGASYLRITSTRFVFCSLFRKSPLIEWREVSMFRTARIPNGHQKLIVFDWHTRADARLARINRFLVGGGSALPDTYGMKAEDLAELMNAWRTRALGTEAEPDAHGNLKT